MKLQQPNVYFNKARNKWVVDLRYHGGQRECRYATQELALSRAETFFDDLMNHGRKAKNDFAPEVTVDVVRSLKLLEEFGPDATIWKAAEHYAGYLKQKAITSVSINKATTDWLAVKEREGLNKASITNHKSRIKAFCLKFGTKYVHELNHDVMHEWIHGLDLSFEGKRDYRKTTREFFNWCIFPMKWIQVNPCQFVKLKRKFRKEVDVLPIEEVEAHFKAAIAADWDIKIYFLLCCFAGLRPKSEARKVTKDDINFETNHIRVHSSKTGEFRYIPMEKGLADLLKEDKWKKKLIQANFPKRWETFRQNLGYKIRDKNPDGPAWTQDLYRHTYCSYHFAHFRNEAMVCSNSGHDFKTFRAKYKRHFTPAEGERFWGLLIEAAGYRS